MADASKPKLREIKLIYPSYQPTRAELREAFDMPGSDMDTVRRAFFQPVRIRRGSKDDK